MVGVGQMLVALREAVEPGLRRVWLLVGKPVTIRWVGAAPGGGLVPPLPRSQGYSLQRT